MPLFHAVVRDVWNHKYADRQQRVQRAKHEVALLEQKNQKIVDALLDGTFDKATYETQREIVGTALEQARTQQSEALISADQVECLLGFAE